MKIKIDNKSFFGNVLQIHNPKAKSHKLKTLLKATMKWKKTDDKSWTDNMQSRGF